MKVLLHLADGFEEIEALSIVDILRRADINIKTVSITGKKEVLGAHNIVVVADELFEQADYTSADMLILPGGSVGTDNLKKHAGLGKQLLLAAKEEKWLAAICAAPTVLGHLGLLKGKSATCYPGLQDQLTGANTTLADSVITDGKIITSRGPGTTFAFALTIVEIIKGAATAATLKKQMLL